MGDPFGGAEAGKRKADGVANAINRPSRTAQPPLPPVRDRWRVMRRYWHSVLLAFIILFLGLNYIRLSQLPQVTAGIVQPEKAVPEEPPVVEKPEKSPERTRAKDGAKMVLIPEGEFQMGSNDGNGAENPVHKVNLDAFYIDIYEVTVGQYKRFVQATGHRAPDWSDVAQYSPTDNHPIIDVSWEDARTYAQWAGASLPTEAQWEKAARGGLVSKKYPWGDEAPNARGTYRANYDSGDNDADGYEYCAPVGSFPANDYGLYDMAGNVWEWCLDAYESDYYSRSPNRNPVNSNFTNVTRRVLRGGSWLSSLNLRCASRSYNNPPFRLSLIGFRCVVSED